MWTRLVYGALLAISFVALAADGLSTTGDRDGRKLFGGYRITPKFCRASKTLPRSDPRSHGPTICMFNHECTQRQGEVVGACMDGFLFGACCQLQGSIDSSLVVEHELYQQSAAAQSYESYGNQQQHQSHGADQTNKVTGSQNSVEEPIHYADRPALPSHNRPSTNNFGGLLDTHINQNNNHYGSVVVEDESSNSVDGQLSNSNEDYPSPPKFVVDNNSVSVSSPSPDYGSSSSHTTSSSYNTASSTESYSAPTGSYISSSPTQQQGELPTRNPTGTFSSTGGDSIIGSGPEGYEGFADAIMHIQSGDFTHSGITHPGVDAVIVDEGTTGYGNPTITVDRLNTVPSTAQPSTTTERTFKITHAKPLFRPKPTPAVQGNKTPDADKYVLIQTINHDVPVKVAANTPKPQGAMSVNDIEAIESIILMLNDTKTGPQYNSDSSSTEPTGTGSTFYYDPVEDNSNTASIYGVQGTTSQQRPSTTGVHYITEKVPPSTPKPPSTSYVYSPQPTKRPIQVHSTISSSLGAIQQDISPEHLNLPSSSEGYYQSPQVVPVTKRPVLITSSSFVTRLPTTGYVYSTHSTVRPTTQDDEPLTTVYTKKPTTTKVSTKRPSPTTPSTLLPKVPSPTTIQSPSTNFIYSTTVPTKRITKPTNKVNPTRKNITETTLVSRPLSSTSSPIVYEEIIQSKPVKPSPTSERPNPTVHITPKPTSNQVTSSIWSSPTNINHYTTPTIKPPTTSYVFVSTERPSLDYSTTDYNSGYGSAVVYSPTASSNFPSNQFDDPGYHNPPSVIRPEVHHQGSSVSPPRPGFYGPTPPFGNEVQDFVEYSTVKVPEEVYTAQNDLNNFPPVRNPNLNTTSNTGHQPLSDYEISTPSFVEDDVLDDKMSVLVSKIVQSLQGNFEQLADVVYDDVVQQDPVPVSTRPPANTKRPSSSTTKKPTVSTKRPAVTSKPTARPAAVATKKPAGVSTTLTTKKPVVTSTTAAKRTTKKPTTATTKKPVVTKVPSTRRPTPKPTKKVIPTTTVQQDEVVDEDEEEEEGEGEENSEEDAEQTTAFEEGRLQCGVRPQLKTGRIVGGKAAAFGEFPWQVLVRESTWLGLFTKNKCGGVLISKMYVMTAAHCQPGFLASLVTVFGEFDISGELEAKRSVTKNVRRVVVHRDYDASTFENDLALLELESAIHYDTHIVPICMPSDAADFTGRVATVTGWGRLKYGGGVPTVMQEVQVPVIENSVCQEMFHTAGHNKKILSSFLCAGYANGQKDSCEGDSGGPLVIQRQDGRWELAGTVSHGIKCAAPYLPGVYMRTTFYKPWLKSITGVH